MMTNLTLTSRNFLSLAFRDLERRTKHCVTKGATWNHGDKHTTSIIHRPTYVALLKIWWQRFVLMANDDWLRKKVTGNQ